MIIIEKRRFQWELYSGDGEWRETGHQGRGRAGENTGGESKTMRKMKGFRRLGKDCRTLQTID